MAKDTVLIQDRPDVSAEAHLTGALPVAKQTHASPSRQPDSNQGNGGQYRAQASAMEYGSAEHSPLISSTKVGPRERPPRERGGLRLSRKSERTKSDSTSVRRLLCRGLGGRTNNLYRPQES